MSDRNLPGPDRESPGFTSLEAAILGASQLALLENLYVAYAPEARSVARAILSDAELAADAVHNGFLEMLRYLAAGRRWYDPAEARAMVLRNVRWAALNLHRTRSRQSRGVNLAPGAVGGDELWARAEARALCEQIVGRLGAGHQTAIRLRYVEGLSNVEAAERLGVTVDVIESRLARALRAARRAARTTGLLPQVVAVFDKARRISRGGPRRSTSPPPRILRSAIVAATLAVAVQGGISLAGADDRSVAGGTPRGTAAAPAAMRLGSLDEATVLDSVALPHGVVLALARGGGCTCLVVFRSRDAGSTWEAAAGPPLLSTAPRLAVPVDSPHDARIVVDLGDARPLQVSPRFGAPFAASDPAPELALTTVHAEPCGSAAAPRFCRGGVANRPAQSGTLLALPHGRLAYFPPYGGVLCSENGGLSWQPRCLPAGQ